MLNEALPIWCEALLIVSNACVAIDQQREANDTLQGASGITWSKHIYVHDFARIKPLLIERLDVLPYYSSHLLICMGGCLGVDFLSSSISLNSNLLNE
jgi:hypothetical protein